MSAIYTVLALLAFIVLTMGTAVFVAAEFSLTTLITGYLAEPLIARLLEPVFAALSLTESIAGGLALGLSLLIATSVSMVFGELVAQYLAVAKPLETARMVAGPQVLFSTFFTPLIKLTNGTANWILRR